MISDGKLKKLALCVSIAGIILIFAASYLVQPPITDLNIVTDHDVGKIVQIRGYVESVTQSNGNIFIKLENSTLSIVMFERAARGHQLVLNKGDFVSVTGQVNVYKTELEIIASSISKE